MKEKELPPNYRIDESGADIVVLYYLTEIVGNYNPHSRLIIDDAHRDAKKRHYEELEEKGLGHWDEDGEWVRDFITTEDGITPPIKEEE